ncbi:hypothetical protein AB0M46_22895 [Dactylosporangium sp. NPDC051485]|uniref:hypothetical protein n=1 Tax=Dactylosporangium sp. NPDC051485 TaxID=3154846 RepID=UPI00344808FD
MSPVLYCLATDDETAAVYESWRGLAQLDVELVVDRRPPTEPVPALAARVAATVDGRDHVLLASGAAAELLVRTLPEVRTVPRFRRVFLLDAAVPHEAPPDGTHWPISAICATGGTPATPSAVAGWRRYAD